MDHGDAAKIIGGGFGAFLGALLTRIGIKKRKRRIEESDPENGDHDKINRLEWDVKLNSRRIDDHERRLRDLERS